MATVFVMVSNNNEKQVLRIICESFGFDVLQLPVSNNSLPQLIQYNPSAIIVEITEEFQKQDAFIKQIRTQAKIKNVKILTYGNGDDPVVIQRFSEFGKTTYFPRPLNTQNIKQVLRPQTGKSSTLNRDYKETYNGEIEDTAVIMDRATPPGKRLDLIVSRIGDLLAFPFTIAKVLSVTQSSTTGAGDLAKAIEIDPVVVSSILKVANSALYGRAGTNISTIKDAIVRIGFVETKNIAISLSVMMLFPDEENSIGFDRKEFWFHSLSSAVIAGKLAVKARYKHPEIPFVCGLLHDFGIILLDEFFPTLLFSTLRSATQKGVPFAQEHKDRWGITHNEVVCRLFEQWNMPDEILLPLKEWNNAFSYSHPLIPQFTLLVHLVRSADIIAKSLELGRECDEYVLPITDSLFEEFKVENQVGDPFFKLINDDINMFSTYLQLDHKAFSFNRDIPKSRRELTVNFIDFKNSYFNPFEFYLITQNVQLYYKKTADEITDTKGDIELIVIYCAKDTTIEMITPFTDVKIKEKDESEVLPILLIGDESLRKRFSTLPDHCGFISNKVDLRILIFSMNRLKLGHPLEEIKTEKVTEAVEPTEKAQEKSSIATRVIAGSVVVLTLKGTMAVDALHDLKKLISTLLTKTKTLIIDFKELLRCDESLLLLLEELRKILRSKGIILVLCSLGGIPQCLNAAVYTEILYTFDTDAKLLLYLQSLLKK